MTISLIAAMGTNRVIGNGPKMPWRLPDELAYFMNTTRDHWVLMGRLTFESYKSVMKNHKVIVVTRKQGYDAGYAKVVNSISEGIDLARDKGEQELFISGGGQIFEESLPLAKRIYITIIDQDFEGDVYFPKYDHLAWKLISEKFHNTDKRHLFSFTYYIYESV
ncbi:MAG TPA: dihydrofolate reductase [Bacteroidales bacterium]|nr:dihydrofolate reductase [Bacteroidales bacterium]HRX98365.1 dihydrofolate reductase [Bacteroidales bacterium]